VACSSWCIGNDMEMNMISRETRLPYAKEVIEDYWPRILS